MNDFDFSSVQAILFDKDGTLFDFQKTWGHWAKQLILDLSGGDAALITRISDVLGFDFETAQFSPDSISIACTPEEQVDLLHPLLPQIGREALSARMVADETNTSPVLVDGTQALLHDLSERGIKLGVVTNDFERGARMQLKLTELEPFFDTIIGFDSGFGGKPAPGGCLAGAKQLNTAANDTVMVGDSLHDLHAGRAAGMRTIGVLTGTAQREELEPHADIVLDDISRMHDLF